MHSETERVESATEQGGTLPVCIRSLFLHETVCMCVCVCGTVQTCVYINVCVGGVYSTDGPYVLAVAKAPI